MNDDCPTTGWCQQAFLKAGVPSSESLGYSSDAAGEFVVLGAAGEDSGASGVTNGTGDYIDASVDGSGAAFVYRRTGLTWVQHAYLKSSDPRTNRSFGNEVVMTTDTIVVSAPGDSGSNSGVTNGTGGQESGSAANSGGAFVFRRIANTWTQEAYIKAPDPLASDFLGYAMAIHGDTIVIGASGEDSSSIGVTNGTLGSDVGNVSGSGAAYIFKRTGHTWVSQAYLKAADPVAGDNFGQAVGIFDDTVLVTSSSEDSGISGVLNGTLGSNTGSIQDSGAAYVFKRTGNTWVQQAYLKAADPVAFDNFGISGALHGETIIIGANNEDSTTSTVLNGTGGSNAGAANGSGAAYIYKRTGDTWVQEAYVKPTDSLASDSFGIDVSLNGDVAVVGAYFEMSSYAGVINGTLGSNSGSVAAVGAAYVFRRTANTWVQEAYLKAGDTTMSDLFGNSTGLSGDTIVVGAPGEDSHVGGVINGAWGNYSELMNGSGAGYIYYRKGGPGVLIYQSAGQADPTTTFPISFTVEFSKKIDPSTFNTADITQCGTGGCATGVNWTITNSGDDRTFTLTAISSSTDGTITPSINASSVLDLDGNNNTASSPNMDSTVTKNP